jgi:hypothetical protein
MAAAKPAEAAPLSPERQFLADAQGRLRQHDAEVASLKENYEFRGAYLSECWAAVHAAETELREATPRPVPRMRKQLLGHRYEPEPEPPVLLIEALQAARQRQVEADGALVGIRSELEAAEACRRRLSDAVDRAAWVALAKHAADTGLADEVERKQRAAYDAGLRLMLLYKARMIETKRQGPYMSESLPVMQTLHRIAAYEPFAEDLDDLQGGRSWAAAHDRLMSDPRAEIPA